MDVLAKPLSDHFPQSPFPFGRTADRCALASAQFDFVMCLKGSPATREESEGR